MSRLTRDGTAEPVSRDQILRHARGQGNVHFPCSADHEQDWQPYPVDQYSAICDDHTYIHTYYYWGTQLNPVRAFPPDITLLMTLCYYHWGTQLNPVHYKSFCPCNQCFSHFFLP